MIYLGTSKNYEKDYYFLDDKIVIFDAKSIISSIYFKCPPENTIIRYNGVFSRYGYPKEKIIINQTLTDEYVTELLLTKILDSI